MEINKISNIQKLVVDGFQDWRDFGHVYTKEKDDLILFNYLNEAQYEGRWNFLERVSRGLIINKKTGEIVARPFDKFFNWGENNRTTNAPIKTITEKLDGSLGILYRDDGFKIATRGSFDGDQAQWATEFFNRTYDLRGIDNLLDDFNQWTFLFEIIYPENRIVIDYGQNTALYLIGVRNKITGGYLEDKILVAIAKFFGFPLPKRYEFDNIQDIVNRLETLPYHSEGWVVEFQDGQRFKFKGKEYLRVHKIIHNISFKNTLEAYINDNIQAILDVIPDEFIDDVNEHIEVIEDIILRTLRDVDALFECAPKITRKEFALWVMKTHKEYAPYLFAKLDDKDILPLIYKLAFKDINEI